MSKRIELRLVPHEQLGCHVWAAYCFDDDNPDPYITDLFDTHIIETPFSEHADRDAVLRRVIELNPDHQVTMP